MIRHLDGIKLSMFLEVFLETVGENIDPVQHGFDSLAALLRHLPDQVVIVSDEEEDPTVQVVRSKVEVTGMGPEVRLVRGEIRPGWGSVLRMTDSHLICLQMEDKRKELGKIEWEMEQFYTVEVAGQKVDPSNLVMGLPVAALYIDMAWHRGVVVRIRQEEGTVEIEYVDWGWRALVKSDTVRRLDERFGDLPYQSVMVRCVEMKTDGRVSWRQAVKDGRGRVRVVISGDGLMFLDLFIKSSKRKKSHNQVSRWCSNSADSILQQNIALSKLVTASLGKIREKGRGTLGKSRL